jgi:O-antigen/teichoic acid export membrane protein
MNPEVSMVQPEGRSRRVTHNTLFLYGAEASARLFSWALLAYLTRHWTDVGTYGQYALAVNWVSIVAIFSDLGLNVLVVREVAHRREQALFYLRYSIAIRAVFSFAFWIGLIAISFVLGYEPILKMGMAVMGLRILLDSIAGGYVYLFQSHEMMGFYSLSNVLSAAARLLGIVIVIQMGGGVVEACAIWTLASGIALLVLMWKGHQLGWKPDFSRLNFAEARSILRQSIPLATFGSLQMLYYRVDSVILKSLSGNEAVGYYDLAAKVLFVVLVFSQIFGTAIFPVFSSVRDDAQAFGQKAGRSLKFLFLLGVPTAVGGILLAQPIILLISGTKYFPSVPMFAVLMLSVGPYFLSHIYVISLAIYNVTRLNIQFAILFILNAGLNFILIPHIGGVGASWATVICEVFGLALGFGLAAPYLKALQWSSLIKPLLACLGASALMGFGIWWDPRLYWLALGPAIYATGLWLLGGLEPEDWKSILLVLRRKTA